MHYTQITHHIRVSVLPMYLDDQSDPDDAHYVWSYTVQIENLGNETVQLINRYWHITDALGQVQEVRGSGVIGQQPVLPPGESHEYSSGVALTTSSGIMMGHYEMRNADGRSFLVDIPAFSLDTPIARRMLN